MKKLFALVVSTLLALSAMAQSAEEIISRMDEAMSTLSADGMAMTVEAKVPIMGTMSTRTLTYGNKMMMEMTVMGNHSKTWVDTDKNMSWTYLEEENTLLLSSAEDSDDGDEAKMFSGITEGYDVSIKKDMADSWLILCKKSKANKSKDEPKTMEILVAKGTYAPVALYTKMSGVNMMLKDISFGVKESDVTFDESKYTGATIVDKRQ